MSGAAANPRPPAEHVATTATDSILLVRDARRQQKAFEDFRFSELPMVEERANDESCAGERLARYCLRPDEWRVPTTPESPRVRNGRAALVARLDYVAGLLPGDHWTAGQLVRYLVEMQKMDDADAAAGRCRAESWWCLALAAYVHHSRADFASAESTYAAALRVMPVAERARWNDLAPLLDEDDRRAYAALDSTARASIATTFWWLADPLYAVPTNERLIEHFARHTLRLMYQDAATVDRLTWGRDIEEALLRMGPPWRVQRLLRNRNSLRVLALYPSGGREFLPPLDLVADPFAIADGDWTLRQPRHQTEYRPSYARRFHDFQHQIASFRRGDSVLVVIAGDLPFTVASSDEQRLALWIHRGPTAAAEMFPSVPNGPRVLVTAMVEPRDALVSLEALARDSGLVARARYGQRFSRLAGSGLALSDLLLLDEAPGAPDSLERAIPFARSSNRIRAGGKVRLYWELYGVTRRGAPMDVGVSVRELDTRTGVLRAIVRRLFRSSDDPGVETAWRTTVRGAPIVSQSVTVSFPRVSPGTYALELSVQTPEGTATSVRRIRIEP